MYQFKVGVKKQQIVLKWSNIEWLMTKNIHKKDELKLKELSHLCPPK